MAKKKTTLPNTKGRQKAQAKYNSKPSSVRDRVSRNKARRKMIRAGKARVGDGKDVDHKNSNPRNNSEKNLRMRGISANRSDNAKG